jgi:hypothetical protein
MISEDYSPGEGRIVLSKSEFDEAYQDNSPLMNLLVPTIEKDDICFIGCRPRDRYISKIFDICSKNHERVRTARGSPYCGSKRYILLGVEEPEADIDVITPEELQKDSEGQMQEENAYYRNLGIEVWRYPAPNGDHSALWRVLEPLAKYPRITPSYQSEGGCLYGT